LLMTVELTSRSTRLNCNWPSMSWLRMSLRRRRIEPCVIVGLVDNHRLTVVQFLHRLAGRLGNDGAAGDVEIGVVRP